MRIKTALILCAGFGKRLNPLTLKKPKPLIELNNVTILESCIKTMIQFGVKKIFLNTFHLSNQISEFIKNKNFPIEIQIVDDGKTILDTGGGILNMINQSKENDFIILNPDTLWDYDYVQEIQRMEQYYFSNKLKNILLVVSKELSFDKNFEGDFELKNNVLNKNKKNDFIYTGCQILNRKLFDKYSVESFPITEIWDDLLNLGQLNGFESVNKFYHLTNLKIFKKLKDL